MLSEFLPEGVYDKETINGPLKEYESHYLELIESVEEQARKKDEEWTTHTAELRNSEQLVNGRILLLASC